MESHYFISTLKITFTKNQGAFAWQAAHIVSFLILVYDFEEVIRKTLMKHNHHAISKYKLW
jgi:hypothetical protein